MALIWMWRYGDADVHEEPDDDWIGMLWHFDNGDQCSVDGVEVAGLWIDVKEVRRMEAYVEYERRQDERYNASIAKAAEYTHLKLRHPSQDKWTWFASGTADEMAARADELSALYGDTRVRLIAPR